MELRHVQSLVDVPGDGPDLCPQLLLYAMQSKPVVVGDQIDGHTEVAEPATPSDPVQVSLGHLREVEIDHYVDCLDVDTTCEQI